MPVAPTDITAVHRGLDAAAATAAFGNVPDHVMTDHFGHDVAAYENMTHLHSRCQQALKRAIWEEEHELPPYLHADPLEGVQLGERDKVTDPRIVYYIGATRSSAAIMVSRLILALYHASHLFLVHVDLKAEGVYEQIDNVVRQHPNIHMLGTRRLVQVPCAAPPTHMLPRHAPATTPRPHARTHARPTPLHAAHRTHARRTLPTTPAQWGSWTMMLPLLDALKTITERTIDYDFVINLSDADVALRTHDEILRFLRPYRGRNLVQVHTGDNEWLAKARNFTAAHTLVECGGYGYVAINSSGPIDLGSDDTTGLPHRVCCFGRTGPILYSNVSLLHATAARQAVEADEANATKLYTGSQWVILDRAFSTYLVTSPAAARWMRVFERRFLSDEGFLHTALMHSPHRHTLVNTNLRYIMWPHHHGDPTSYWATMGWSFIGGPEVINASEAPKVDRSPFAHRRLHMRMHQALMHM